MSRLWLPYGPCVSNVIGHGIWQRILARQECRHRNDWGLTMVDGLKSREVIKMLIGDEAWERKWVRRLVLRMVDELSGGYAHMRARKMNA